MMRFIQQFYQDCLVKFALMGGVPDPGAPDGDWGICVQSAARAFGDDGKHPGNVKAFGRTGKEI